MFEKVVAAPADPILGLTEEFKKDPRTDKINLGVGIYKNEAGETPVLATVKKAEAALLESEKTKSYLTIEGTAEYGLAVQKLLFGANSDIVTQKLAKTAQAPGGTGALRVAGEFIKRQLGDVKVWISNPTWANHHGVFNAAGLETTQYAYYDAKAKDKDFAAMLADLEQAEKGDVVLLHGCCHNPTGIDPTEQEWEVLAKLVADKGLLPLFDFAYQALLQVWKKTRLAYVFLRNTTLRFWLPALSQRTLACTTNVSVPSRWLHLQQPLQKRRSHKLKRLSALSTQTHRLTVLPLSLIF